MKNLKLIVAMDNNNGIGINGKMPWHLPIDLEWFKKTTVGHTCIMGRKTWESIGSKPLPNRTNIVMTHKKLEGVSTVSDIFDVLNLVKKNPNETFFITGGASLYEMFLPFVDEMYVTYVDREFDDIDTVFPEFNDDDWKCTYVKYNTPDTKNRYGTTFMIYKRNLN